MINSHDFFVAATWSKLRAVNYQAIYLTIISEEKSKNSKSKIKFQNFGQPGRYIQLITLPQF
jgi:hypothetical protein